MRSAIEVIGDRKVEHDLKRLADKVADPRPAFERLVHDLQRIEQQTFDTRGHGSWPANKDQTQRQKTGSKPGIDSGDLMASLTSRGKGSRVKIGRDELVFGTRIIYARFLLARFPGMVKPQEGDRRNLIRSLRDHLLGHIA